MGLVATASRTREKSRLSTCLLPAHLPAPTNSQSARRFVQSAIALVLRLETVNLLHLRPQESQVTVSFFSVLLLPIAQDGAS
jgi:hypothetical protein